MVTGQKGKWTDVGRDIETGAVYKFNTGTPALKRAYANRQARLKWRRQTIARWSVRCAAVAKGNIKFSSKLINVAAVLAHTSVLALVGLHWSGGQDAAVLSYNGICVYLNIFTILYYMRGSDWFGPFISLINEVINSILPFFFVMATVLAAFFVSMTVLLDSVHPYDETDEISISAVVNVMLAAHDTGDYIPGGVVAVSLMIITVILVGLLMSNLLINIFGSIYSQWEENKEAEKLLLRAQLCQHSWGSSPRHVWKKLKQLYNYARHKKPKVGYGSGHFMFVLKPTTMTSGEQWSTVRGGLTALRTQANEQARKIGTLETDIKKIKDNLELLMENLLPDHNQPSSHTRNAVPQRRRTGRPKYGADIRNTAPAGGQ